MQVGTVSECDEEAIDAYTPGNELEAILKDDAVKVRSRVPQSAT